MSASRKLPSVAIVGRVNVGKSTLFNRIVGKRRALTSPQPGMTRDRHFATADWCGCQFEVVDTGGIESGSEVLSSLISEQALEAISDAAVIFFVVDGKSGLTAGDEEIATLLRRTGRPVVLLVNKSDSPSGTGMEADFLQMGFDPVFAVSAEHGLNVDLALDYLIEKLKLRVMEPAETEQPVRVAIIGKPNAGKSTLLNRILGKNRLVTSEVPGTTRDTIDIDVREDGQLYRFIDTAGIRKKGQTKTVPDKLAVIHARKSLERSDIACIMVDASAGITHQDAVVAGYARDAGLALVLILNKIDLLDPEQRRSLEMEVDSKLKFISYVPQVFLSAKTGKNVRRIFPVLKQVYGSYTQRVSTGQLNAFFDSVLTGRYLGTFRGKPIKLKYITQTGIQPPTFVLFTNAASRLHFSHIRFLENRLRMNFGFAGATIRIKVRRG